MGTTAELDTSKYEVDDATADQFYNIANFARSMTIKDSKYFEEAETPLSKRFADLMIKYFDSGLSNSEIEEIITFVNEYNSFQDKNIFTKEIETDIKNINDIKTLFCNGIEYTYDGYEYIGKEQISNFSKENIIINGASVEKKYIIFSYKKKNYKWFKDELEPALIREDETISLNAEFSEKVYFNSKEYFWNNDEKTFYTYVTLRKNTNITFEEKIYFWDGDTFYRTIYKDDEGKEITENILKEYIKRYCLNDKNYYNSSILNLIMTELKNFSPDEVEKYYSEIQTFLILNHFKEIINGTINAVDFSNNLNLWYDEYGKYSAADNSEEGIVTKEINLALKVSESQISDINILLSKYIFYTIDEKGKIINEYIYKRKEKGEYGLFYKNNTNKEEPEEVTLKFKFNNKFWNVYETTFTEKEEEIEEEDGKKKYYSLEGSSIKLDIDSRDTIIGHILFTLKQEILNLKEAYINKNKIIISDAKSIDSDSSKNIKNIASEEERILLKNANLIVMDIEFNKNRYMIVYKELNSKYRELFEYDIMDLILHFKNPLSQGNKTTSEILQNRFIDSITVGITNYLRTIRDSFILIKDFSNINMTTKDFKYIYGNPYYARKASESEIIKYFINNPRILSTNAVNGYGYGVWSYEREEIYNFIEIYKNIHEYFYKVLLNESFVNENEYKLFEKTFLIFWSIERFISSKIDNLKDINVMSIEDVKNFLTSYGLGELSEIIEKNAFYDSESYSKNILKRFIDIVQNKGTHKVLNILQEIFSDSNSELVIFNSILEYNKNSENEENYYFFESLYEEENRLKSIFDNDSKKIAMESYTANDRLWDTKDTSVDLLKELNVYNSQTKYLIPQLTEEISESFFMTRYTFAVIDLIGEALNKYDELKNINIESEVFGALNIKDFIDKIRKSIVEFLMIKTDEDSNSENFLYKNAKYTFKISRDNLIRSGYFTIDINSDEKIKINKDLLKNDFSLKIQKYSSQTENFLSNSIFEGLRYILAFQYLCSSEDEELKNTILTEFLRLNNTPIEIGRASEIIITILESIRSLHFGPNEIPLTNNSWIKGDLFIFLQKLYVDTFMDSFEIGKNILIDTNMNPENTSENDLETILQNIIKSCTELSEILGELIQIRISGTEEAILIFLKETIDYFIAYSAMVYKTIYKVEYRTINEFLHIVDDVHFMKTIQDVDSFYYDESLSIQLENKED